jgi:murein DD-endopeptidase MepM/ murein hydrolase activator NlpD
MGVTWSPEPTEGSAFGIVLHRRPTGRIATSASGEIGGHPIRFGLVDGQWFGVAPVPIGVTGSQTIVVRLGFENGSTSEQLVPVEVRPTEFASTNLSVDSRFSSPPPEVLERIRSESEFVREMLRGVTAEWQIEGSFESPRPFDVTSPFGQARMFNGELRSRHTGLDLRGRTGAPVQAAGRGRVVFAGSLYFAGNAVYVDHGLGVFTGYFHLSKILVETGDMVSTGDLVGEVGATGRVTAAHLHWFLSVGGQSLDAGSLLGMGVPD